MFEKATTFFKNKTKNLTPKNFSSSSGGRNTLRVSVGTNTVGLSTALLPSATMISILSSKAVISLLLLSSLVRKDVHRREKVPNFFLLWLCITELVLAACIYFTDNDCQIDVSDSADPSATNLCKAVILLEIIFSLSSAAVWGTGEFNKDPYEEIINLTKQPIPDENPTERNETQEEAVEGAGEIEIEIADDPQQILDREEEEEDARSNGITFSS